MFRKTTWPALVLALAACAHAQQPTPAKTPAQQSAPAQAAQPQPTPAAAPAAVPQTHLKVGDPAPDFTLRDTEGKEVKLSDFRNKKSVVLAFYVLAFTGG